MAAQAAGLSWGMSARSVGYFGLGQVNADTQPIQIFRAFVVELVKHLYHASNAGSNVSIIADCFRKLGLVSF